MSYNIDLSGQVALVTGASSGLGAQFAKTLAQAGAMVVLASRRVDKLKDLRAEIEANGGQAHICALDVTSLTSIETAIQTIDAEVGAIDILINNSGVSSTQKLKDVTAKDFDFCCPSRGPSHARKVSRGTTGPTPWPQSDGAHHQHCVYGRTACVASNRGLLHEQSRHHSHDQSHGLGVGKAGYQCKRDLSWLY